MPQPDLGQLHERLDLDRIFHVVCDNIESRFSTVFSAALLFDLTTQAFTVAHLSAKATESGQVIGLDGGFQAVRPYVKTA